MRAPSRATAINIHQFRVHVLVEPDQRWSGELFFLEKLP
jgi:hypothetical protein